MAKKWYVVQVYSNFEDKVEGMLRETLSVQGCPTNLVRSWYRAKKLLS